jgi:hypothetical protein
LFLLCKQSEIFQPEVVARWNRMHIYICNSYKYSFCRYLGLIIRLLCRVLSDKSVL